MEELRLTTWDLCQQDLSGDVSWGYLIAFAFPKNRSDIYMATTTRSSYKWHINLSTEVRVAKY